MSSAQERILAQYHGLMQVNASSHLLRSAREIGLIGELREGQRTLEQLRDNLSLSEASLQLFLDGLMSIGIVEKYDEDHALSRAGHLLCQYDDDLGDSTWSNLPDLVRGKIDRENIDDQAQHDYLAATQWSHTASAMQAAEILDIGGQDEPAGLRILDLGCGSAVWSCAMSYRDPESTLTAVDGPGAIEAATATAESIELGERFSPITSLPEDAELPAESFDLVILAQRISCLDEAEGKKLIDKAVAATAPNGRLIVIDLFRGNSAPSLSESLEALKLNLGTRGGYIRSLEEIQANLAQAGLGNVQFTYLAASRINLGMAVGRK
ncbi:methyltransferase domain-containing protein [Rubripirellula amarantea]|nr:methyltransferase domain-containing protein [Rubripirellula amarantea]